MEKQQQQQPPPSKKFRLLGEITGVEDDTPLSRSERKREREKKRRSDVNKGFDNLMRLLLEIDPEVRRDAEDRARKGHCKRTLVSFYSTHILSIELNAGVAFAFCFSLDIWAIF